jgi:adenylate cyclase
MKESHKIHLFKEEQIVNYVDNKSILEATLAAKINHTHACGGNGKCSTCRVSVTKGLENCSPRSEAEQVITDKLNFPNEVRLACQTKITGDISMRRMVADKMDMDIIFEQFSEDAEIALGSQQKLTIVFTDIVNYTAFAEKFPPYDIVHVLNRYYRLMNAIIKQHGGIISDVAGDGILAVFGTDKSRDNSVLDAINAINGMNLTLETFNNYLEANFNTKFGIRAGVHYGNVIVGPFDTGAMKKMAVIGDNVNYASRIESANKEFGTKLLVSEEAYKKVASKFPDHKIYKTTLKGKTGYYKLYSI